MRALLSPSTRAVFSVIAVALATSSSCGAQLTIALVRANDLAETPPFVKLLFATSQGTQPESGPYPTAQIPREQFEPIPPGTRFFIDVIGCRTADPLQCVLPQTFVARGCTEVIAIDKRDNQIADITLHTPEIGARNCPPPGL